MYSSALSAPTSSSRTQLTPVVPEQPEAKGSRAPVCPSAKHVPSAPGQALAHTGPGWRQALLRLLEAGPEPRALSSLLLSGSGELLQVHHLTDAPAAAPLVVLRPSLGQEASQGRLRGQAGR